PLYCPSFNSLVLALQFLTGYLVHFFTRPLPCYNRMRFRRLSSSSSLPIILYKSSKRRTSARAILTEKKNVDTYSTQVK
ncbi:hypothetical protein C0J52_07388, partial [Blattella germanica]